MTMYSKATNSDHLSVCQWKKSSSKWLIYVRNESYKLMSLYHSTCVPEAVLSFALSVNYHLNLWLVFVNLVRWQNLCLGPRLLGNWPNPD